MGGPEGLLEYSIKIGAMRGFIQSVRQVRVRKSRIVRSQGLGIRIRN